MEEQLIIKVVRLNESDSDIPLPEYSTPDSSGLDIRAAVTEPLVLAKGTFTLVPTGLSVEIPTGYELQVRPRSGLAAKHGVTVLNSPGTIDADYRGEIKIILINLGYEDFVIRRGDRIAQMVPTQVTKARLVTALVLPETTRGSGGFGHTGNC